MKKLTFLSTVFALLAALLVSTPSFAKGPLSEGKFGVGASFASSSLVDQAINDGRGGATPSFAPRAQFLYTLSDQLQLDLGVGFQTISVDPPDESATAFGINVGGKYFLSTVPFVGVEFSYSSADDSYSENSETDTFLMISALLGGQVMIENNLGVYGQVGFGYGKYSDGREDAGDVSVLGFTTAAVGASFYFN